MDAQSLWELVHLERASLAADLAGLAPDEWAHGTLCTDWNVEQVVAHLTAAASTNRSAWLRSMLGAGFKPDVHNQRRLAEQLGETPNDTLRRFDAVITSKVAPTKDVAAYLGEVVVHSTDIRIPLGVATVPGIEALTPVAEFFARRNFAVPSKTVVRGLTLRATDGPFVAGAGPRAAAEPEVSGPTLALVMAMAGRGYFLDQLAGDGVSILRERLAT